MSPLRTLAIAGTMSALLLTGCQGEPAVRPPPDPVTAASPAALTIDSTTACGADADCAMDRSCFQGQCVTECAAPADCSAGESCVRGRCRTGGSAPATAEADVALHITNVPDARRPVSAGQATVTLHLELDGPVPAAGLAYRIERSDDAQAGAKLSRATGTTAVDIPVAVGAADPARGANAQLVKVTVYTPVGRINLQLEPQQPVAGVYSGSLSFTNLGTLPIEFQVVTEPSGATLATATAKWVVLDVTESGFLSPQDAAAMGGPTKLASPITLDTVSGKYVALFNHAFALGAGASRVFQPAAGTSGRGLRFELEQTAGGALQGNLVDVWSGLYELQGTGGMPAPATTYQVGALDVRRAGEGLSAAEVRALPMGASPGVPVAMGEAPLGACSSALLNTFPVACHDMNAGTDDLAAFASADAATRAACANDAVTAALGTGTTVTAKLAEYTSTTPPTAGSFQAFLDDCSKGTNGTCVPAPAVLCARQLAAHAYQGLDGNPALGNVVLQSYLDATREATLGPQLAAFWNDYQARLSWLQVDGAPSVVASALTNDALSRLDAWKTAVLDKHLATLAVQLDASARVVFARVPSDMTLAAARTNALSQLSQSWRGAADALGFMVRRWNVLQQQDTGRAASAAQARVLARDLYLVAAVVTGLSGTSGSIATAPFRGAFGTLVRNITELGLPFQSLVFSRDAEVVVSTSLDPMSSTASILSQRRTAAMSALATATTQVDQVVDGVIADGLTQLQFSGALAVELQAAQADLQRLCGLPAGCTAAQLGTTPQCAPHVTPGTCGFVVDQAGTIDFENEANLSRAGAQVLEVLKAANALRIAAAARDAQLNTVQYSAANLEAFANSVQAWNTKRQETLTEMNTIFSQQNDLQDQALQALINGQAALAQTRADAIASDLAEVEKWNRLRLGTLDSSFEKLTTAFGLQTASNALSAAAQVTEFVTPLIADMAYAQAAVGGALDAALLAGSVALQGAADGITLNAQREQAYADAQLTALEQASDVGAEQTDADLAALQEAIDRAQALSQAQIDALNRALELGRQQRANELAYQRDLAELNDKRLAHLALVQQLPRFELEVDQAALAVQQRVLEYRLTVQDAQLAEARRALLQAQYTDASSLLGSPAVVFSRVNRLDRAELYLQTARDRLMDWLTALEYLAVRPFVDHRMRILLARNPLQLERVALSLDELQNTCGGNTSQASLDVSVRDQLLGLDKSIADVDGAVLTPAARFRSLLERGSIPIDRRVRYSTDTTVGGLLSRSSGVLAASFSLSLSDFGNLALACNAKMVSFDVQLVGAIGSGQPVVTVLYDGTSQVRSCQPDIDAYVNSIGGPKWTHFGSVTLFHTTGRSASPNAGINEYLAGDNANVTLDGLPLASEYTLLIDTTVGDNSKLDWSKLEDVRLRINYGYQDLFAAGQCRD